ncbi:MAG: peptidylprolyl isomerase [Rhodocyclaceae bacterium]|nr:peptidylprolyl isomerase [Rhodocyclaceae bacterium]
MRNDRVTREILSASIQEEGLRQEGRGECAIRAGAPGHPGERLPAGFPSPPIRSRTRRSRTNTTTSSRRWATRNTRRATSWWRRKTKPRASSPACRRARSSRNWPSSRRIRATSDRGGDLGWSAPSGYVKPFADAMVALEKGKFSATPVNTQFGWHVILLDDIRDLKHPPLEEVKPQIQQRLQQQILEKHITELRAKAKIE